MEKSKEVFFDFQAGGYCGLILDVKTTKKVIKLQIEYNEKIQKLLTERKEFLRPSNWTMSDYKGFGGNVVYCNYIDSSRSVEDQIKLFKIQKPTRIENFLDTDNREVAKRWCNRKALEKHDIEVIK